MKKTAESSCRRDPGQTALPRRRTFTIREYAPEDLREMAALFYQTVHSVNAADYSEEERNAWADGCPDLETWNRSFLERYTLVAEKDGRIAGFGNIGADGYLDKLYVHKEYQGRGIASALCEMLEKRFPIKTVVTHASITAKPFFEKRGYIVIRRQRVERKGIFLTNFVMEKKTAADAGKE